MAFWIILSENLLLLHSSTNTDLRSTFENYRQVVYKLELPMKEAALCKQMVQVKERLQMLPLSLNMDSDLNPIERAKNSKL